MEESRARTWETIGPRVVGMAFVVVGILACGQALAIPACESLWFPGLCFILVGATMASAKFSPLRCLFVLVGGVLAVAPIVGYVLVSASVTP